MKLALQLWLIASLVFLAVVAHGQMPPVVIIPKHYKAAVITKQSAQLISHAVVLPPPQQIFVILTVPIQHVIQFSTAPASGWADVLTTNQPGIMLALPATGPQGFYRDVTSNYRLGDGSYIAASVQCSSNVPTP